ncbi:probable glycosyltransferase At3g07620 [Brassica rapa]|uniref:Exostosin GT47 domain-containing protein n=1 Tax=Brassica campestris TaxID=3711 RepID=A0A3P6C0Z5_BRACM|nr:probable glycosyltransferase At3g07620 [Brassica rapa]XP_033145518.1 probable glycosyltransferase At3g07620 [Brassica rapa]XP_033145519.1 probable glycosyltransferase At3g07620 [Brassica rapa]XP_033145520.1 probable glycosyltransferase At3g07620 [Brassica rapa]XP_033145521.1 probable glycosyltransferase At3g07620 [Brassica rapa]XP_033145522.1 probable glycosyltransferase At3g07620 [Brassica rapa]XP_033145523.1 probable glycosyltransferase At3g07620 [Brassica rapa]XP_033145524.1 probable g
MRILTRLERFDIRRLLSGIIVTVGLVVLLVLCFGIPCRNSFCLSPVNVSGIVANSNEVVSVVKTEINLSSDDDDDEYEEETRNNGSSRENVKVELNVSINSSPNVSLGKPEMAVEGSVLVRSNVLPILKRQKQVAATDSISQMNSLLIRSLSSSHSPKPRWSSARDSEMLSAKFEIENASVVHESPGLDASVYRNISKFLRSYDLMERKLRVYVYKEGKKPIFHRPMPRGIYASEGWFMKLMESNKKFLVKDPRKAHLFYIPVSIKALRTSLGLDFQTPKGLADHLKEYVDLIAAKYKFWNRTAGADHFLVACHDWGNKLTKKHMSNSVRALCNSNVAQGFRIGIDTALPVTYIRSAESPIEYRGGKTPSERKILAFFAGSMHGYLRPILVQLWENKSPDMKIFGPMPRDPQGKKQYREYMKSSRYCICARGYEVHTPRVVEAIINECVPVIIADNYVPPFFEVLNWEEFAVFVEEKDIQNLRNILVSIPEERYIGMQARVKTVQQHFLWHKKPVKFDLFHMILHSVWHSRLNRVKTKSRH